MCVTADELKQIRVPGDSFSGTSALHLYENVLFFILVPVWSGVNVGGVRLVDLYPNIGTTEDREQVGKLHQEVVNR